jgi:hypothetical protein
MRLRRLFAAAFLLFAVPARADMYPDGSNAKIPGTGDSAATICQDGAGKLTTCGAVPLSSPGSLNVRSNPVNAIAGYFEGQGAPTALSSQGVWTTWRSYGTGRAAVFDVQAYNSSLALIDQAYVWNMGLQWWDAGHEQSDIDFGGYRNGVLDPAFIAISAGCLNGSNTAANNAAGTGCPVTTLPNLSPGTDNVWTSGTPNLKWKTVYAYGVAGNTVGSPPAGSVGEVVTASVACASPVAEVSGVAKTIVTLPLGAGTWDITGVAGFTGGTTTVVSLIQASISATTNTSDAAVDRFVSEVYPAGGAPFVTSRISVAMPVVRVSPTAPTSYFLVEATLFATSTLSGCGSLRAVRVY